MQIEIIIIAIIVFTIMSVTGQINLNQMVSDNQALFMRLKESDWVSSLELNMAMEQTQIHYLIEE